MSGTLYAKSLPVSDSISIIVPSVGEILDNEDQYYEAVSTIIATPYDMMVQLDDAGIDFTKINDYELFCLLFSRLKELDTHLLFGELDIGNVQTAIDERDGKLLLVDPETDLRIDRVVHNQICNQLRRMLHITRDVKTPGNDEAKRYMIERARRKQKRLSKKKPESQIENYVIALVNTEQFPYNYESVRNISILQFYASLNQIVHKIKYDNTMVGFYAGTIKLEDIKMDDRTWIQNI